MSSPIDPPAPGHSQQLAPGLRRVLAPNPSPMTLHGTNSYILGEGAVAVIDPGPAIPAHLEALLAALAPGERVAAILVTHAHRDHSGLARPLAEATGAPVYARGDAFAGRSEVMRALAAAGLAGGGEGLDEGFAPDETLADGETLAVGGTALTTLWTPGHAANHICLAWEEALFSGDTVMGWASTIVSPPDGDLTAFLASVRRLMAHPARRHYPGHGAPVEDPPARCRWLLNHRAAREAAILAHLPPEGATIPTLTRAVYTDTPTPLLPAAERNVFAHLIDLTTRNRVTATPHLSPDAHYLAASPP